MSINTEMNVRVAAITAVADKVKCFRFERVDGQPMPMFSGGAHIVVSMREGSILRRNPYSLMSSPADSSGYEISVLAVLACELIHHGNKRRDADAASHQDMFATAPVERKQVDRLTDGEHIAGLDLGMQ